MRDAWCVVCGVFVRSLVGVRVKPRHAQQAAPRADNDKRGLANPRGSAQSETGNGSEGGQFDRWDAGPSMVNSNVATSVVQQFLHSYPLTR